MTEINTVQLARFNTTNYASNSEWTTTLHSPVILNDGDTAVVSKAYLDTRLASGGNIVIPNDIPLSITMYFYMMFPPDGTSLSTEDGTPPIDNPPTPAGFPTNAPPALSATSQLNPNDLTLFATQFYLTGPGGGQTWDPYQKGTTQATGAYPPYNDGVPIPPYVSFNSPPLYGYPQDTGTIRNNFINQSWAGEMPLLLITNPTDPQDINTSIPYTKVWNYTLKAGTYSPDELAEILTRAMASIQNPNNQVSNYTPYNQFGTSQVVANLNSFMTKGQQIAIVNTATPNPSPVPIIPYEDDVWTTGMNYSSNDPDFASFIGSPQAPCILSPFLSDAVIPPQYLNFPNNEYELQTNPIVFQQVKYQSGWSAAAINGATTEGITVIDYTSPVIGCSQPEIVFNDQAGIFQFSYTHTPLQELPTGGGVPGQNTGTNPIEVVKVIKTINIDYETQYPPHNFFNPTNSKVNIAEHTKHSGVIFKSLSPPEFWRDILGFDVNAICIPQDEIFPPGKMDYKKFQNITTSGFVGLSNNFNYNNVSATTDNLNQPPYLGPVPLYPQKSGTSGGGELTYTNLLNSARWFGEQYVLQNNSIWGQNVLPSVFDFPYAKFFPFFYEEYASALTATKPIMAINPPLSNIDNVGHFLIEIVAYGGDKEFISSQTVYQVKSILSSYYNTNGNFQSSPFPDSYVYTHTGETQIIHSFKVRIIDPYTMDSATTLGPSSSVYVQFNKILDKISLAQPS